jgi:NAD(P)-dependent dehydrogenase (short-subunit alcohol dehydrogenase family)
MSQSNDLKNQVCVITGAARGMGQEMAVSLAERGAHVVVLARDDRRVGEALSEIRARVPGAVV